MRQKFDIYTLNRPKTKRFVGWFFIVVGVLGVILPIVPGWIVIFIGLEILGIQLVMTDRLKSFFIPNRSKSAVPQEIE